MEKTVNIYIVYETSVSHSNNNYSALKTFSLVRVKLTKNAIALHEKMNFRLTKICEKGRKDHAFVSFLMFPFHRNIIFSELSLKKNVRKQHLSANAYFSVNMKFLYMLARRKDCNENKQFFVNV